MADCCGCCGAFKPRYKKLVDNIFPANPDDGLVKSNMDKLTFFAMKSPEKLDRIGEYLASRVNRDVYRQRYQYVHIAMEALDTLLVTCHAQTLNIFVESFLKMVQKLLEVNEPELQILATASFVKFANIEEDTPSYHRIYDFFVSKFGSLCHNNHDDKDTRERLRVAGLQGLQGVVRKTVSDDLQTNIWEPTHMDKIVPSLLYNIQDSPELPSQDTDSPKEDEQQSVTAEHVFRELVCKASYGNINSVLKPVVTHLDNHNLWVPNHFAVKVFKIIMFSVQAQYGYVVVQMLMSHLDENTKKDPQIKSSIVDTLYETVLIAAGGSIGPSVLDVFNTLLRHLRLSIDANPSDRRRIKDEENFQDKVIDTISEFAKHLPDYQKIEILMFVMGKIPMPSEDGDTKDVKLQTMLLKTILKVATKYKTNLIANAFPPAFLDPLLKISISQDSGIRTNVQKILHTLLDRHDNLPKLKEVKVPRDIAQLDLTVEKAPRADVMFMKKYGPSFYGHIYENMQQLNNRVDNFETLYTTLALVCIEIGGDEVLIELFRLAFGIQAMAMNLPLLMTHKCAIHALVGAYMNLMSQLTAIPALCQHTENVIRMRREQAPHYLPELAFNRGNTADSYPEPESISPNMVFDVDAVSEALRSSGRDTTRLATPYFPKPSGLDETKPTHRASIFTFVPVRRNTMDMAARSASDIHSMSIDFESAASTPLMLRKSKEDVTYDSLKKVLEVNPRAKEDQDRRRRELLESFRTAPFEEIVAKSEASGQQFESKLNEILDMISKPQESPGGTPRKARCEEESIPLYEMQFPDLFVY